MIIGHLILTVFLVLVDISIMKVIALGCILSLFYCFIDIDRQYIVMSGNIGKVYIQA
jgi:hypothetical protein